MYIVMGVSNRWTGFSTGMWDWNMGLECGTGIFNCYSRPYNTLSTLKPSVGTSHKQSMGGLLDR